MSTTRPRTSTSGTSSAVGPGGAGDPGGHGHLPGDALPDAAQAFASVEYIMRDVPWDGWCATCTPTGASASSWSCTWHYVPMACSTVPTASPASWFLILGVAIFLCLMAEAFMGYLLPWGQMSLGRPGDREPVRGRALLSVLTWPS